MTYTFNFAEGRFLIVPDRDEPRLYNLVWEDRADAKTLLNRVAGIFAFQAVVTQDTGFQFWDHLPDETIPAEIYDFSLWEEHRSFAIHAEKILEAV
ncbi:MAG: hypothetical protein AAF212_11755 [Verrucomicrobiota bacterium]